jgi:putative endonuclease
MTMYYVYIIKSQTRGRYYIGYTSDLNQRILAHNSGKNTSTRYGVPWILVHSEKYKDKKSAWLRERKIKSYKGGEAFEKLIK